MKRFIQWAILLVAGLTLIAVATVFIWHNAGNILALIIMTCLFAVVLRQALDLGILQ